MELEIKKGDFDAEQFFTLISIISDAYKLPMNTSQNSSPLGSSYVAFEQNGEVTYEMHNRMEVNITQNLESVTVNCKLHDGNTSTTAKDDEVKQLLNDHYSGKTTSNFRNATSEYLRHSAVNLTKK